MNQGGQFHILPAVIKDYDKVTRTCRVEIPGITKGGDTLPIAEILYPLGDKSAHPTKATEIEILVGDHVYVEFLGGDQRYPLIVGYRNPTTGNDIDCRRFNHANIQFNAVDVLEINAKTVKINAENLQVAAKTAITGSTLTHNGVNVGSDHNHSGVKAGGDNTGNPQ